MLIFYHNVPTIQLSSAALSPSCSPRHDQSHHTILRASHFASVFSYNTTSFNLTSDPHSPTCSLRHDQSHQRPSFANVLTLRVFITTHDQSHQRPTFANVLTSTRLISSATQIRLRVLTTTRSISPATNFRLLAHLLLLTRTKSPNHLLPPQCLHAAEDAGENNSKDLLLLSSICPLHRQVASDAGENSTWPNPPCVVSTCSVKPQCLCRFNVILPPNGIY